MVDADMTTAMKVLDTIRDDFSQLRHLADEKEFSVTFSCGIADVSQFPDATKLSDAADKALYKAKHAGRNQVMLADDSARQRRQGQIKQQDSNNAKTYLSAHVLSGIFLPPIRPMGERAANEVITIVAPPKAQHPQPLRLKNYWHRQMNFICTCPYFDNRFLWGYLHIKGYA